MAFVSALSVGALLRSRSARLSCFVLTSRARSLHPSRAVLLKQHPRFEMSAISEPEAGKRESELRGPEGIFSKIIAKEIKADIVYEDEESLAFRDINPQAPIHIVVIPKRRIALLSDAKEEDALLLGKLMLTAAEVARIEKLDNGYRVLVNNGYDGRQAVGHLHLHVIGGRQLKWGPF